MPSIDEREDRLTLPATPIVQETVRSLWPLASFLELKEWNMRFNGIQCFAILIESTNSSGFLLYIHSYGLEISFRLGAGHLWRWTTFDNSMTCHDRGKQEGQGLGKSLHDTALGCEIIG